MPDPDKLSIKSVKIVGSESARAPAKKTRGSGFTVYLATAPPAGHGAMFCHRHRKVLYAGLLATFVLTASGSTRESGSRLALSATGVETSALHPRSALAPAEELRLILALKFGLREATALFGHFSMTADARNVPTMTAGIRN